MDLKQTHQLSSNHKDLLTSSKKCGCFYCLKIYAPKEVKEWIDNEDTAICPHCGIDAVLPEHDSYKLNKELLNKMNEHWFTSIFHKLSPD